MNKPEYPFNISILSDEDGGGYLIEFPDLPGCISDGDTVDEAIENGKDALFCWIEAAKDYGYEIPLPYSSVHSSKPNEEITSHEENPLNIDRQTVIHQEEPLSSRLPQTWLFDIPVTYPFEI